MKSKIVYDASENTNDEEKTVIQESGLSEKDIAKFKRKMNRLLEYLSGLVKKANHSEETYQMIQEGLMDVMEWFIPIRQRIKDNARRVTVYLNEENCDYLEKKKEKKGTSYSDTVNAALVNYRNSKVQKKAEELVKPTEDKLSQLLYNQVYIMQALGAIYRTGNYGSYLINNGIPIVSINGNDVVKPNQKLKDLARIKAMRNFTKLESEHVFLEDFLEENQEYDEADEEKEDKKNNDSGFHFWQ